MLVNISYNDKSLFERINNEVGKPFNLWERLKMNGTGSPKLFITSSSLQIRNLLTLDNNINTCNIEIRPKGIIIRFRSLLETYALIIPYYKLSLYKGRAQEYSIHRDHYHIKVAAKTKETHEFMRKILDKKSDLSSHFLDDYN
ncbi:hypothetical protein SAMN04487906_2284 [Zhouia amylolytica]|uniref:Arginyl-tRNA synthetase n=2 Tax=Zhouia amylolytica TaxID=376730 RepID=W2US11_9FLAO|nr:hypothetical protein [Zhouia amylolytica]ETN96773.1 arginyl-tRNA synthetase [Zhouia amylolytica AD3]SFS95027.1 hypothetical protein SAMN04487906_2284 [Zhouia amylolytica]